MNTIRALLQLGDLTQLNSFCRVCKRLVSSRETVFVRRKLKAHPLFAPHKAKITEDDLREMTDNLCLPYCEKNLAEAQKRWNDMQKEKQVVPA